MRAIWSGSISFGLVNIPVKLYSASEERAISFDLVHKSDFSPIRYARVCKEEGKEVNYEDITKAYELEDGSFVPIDEKDFERANRRRTKTIEILNFSKEEEIDPIYFEKPYYLEPDKGADKAYALLMEALKRSKRVGVAKYVLRNREHLALIRPENDILLLDQMRFDEEVRKPIELRRPENVQMRDQEISLALALIDQLTEKFQPQKYKDTYTEELKVIIQEKSAGKEIVTKEELPEPTQVKDLMSMLKASLDKEKVRSK